MSWADDWLASWVEQTLDAEEAWVRCVRTNHPDSRRCEACEVSIAQRDQLYLELGKSAGRMARPPPLFKEEGGQFIAVGGRATGKTFMDKAIRLLEDQREQRRLLSEASS